MCDFRRQAQLICYLFIVLCSSKILFSATLKIGEQKIGNIKIKEIKILQNNKNKDELVRLLWKTKLKNAKEINAELKINKGQGGVGQGNPGGILNGNGVVFKTRTAYKPRFREPIQLKDWPLRHLKYGEPESRLSVSVKKAGVLKKGNGNVVHFAQEKVVKWYSEILKGGKDSKKVCAFKFSGSDEREYTLKTFDTAEAAERSGYIITHRYKCGQCSSLRDLAMYIAKPNLTTPVRKCVQKLNLVSMKSCLMKQVGFSEYCAEAWAYNGANTKSYCKKRCMKDYGAGSAVEGAINVLAGNYTKYGEGNTYTDKKGKVQLRPCIACDEYRSGPGFKYQAARTRRDSGLISRIQRKESQQYHLNHFGYFKAFRKRGEKVLKKLGDTEFKKAE